MGSYLGIWQGSNAFKLKSFMDWLSFHESSSFIWTDRSYKSNFDGEGLIWTSEILIVCYPGDLCAPYLAPCKRAIKIARMDERIRES